MAINVLSSDGTGEPAEHRQEADAQDYVQEVVGAHGRVGAAAEAQVLVPQLLLHLLRSTATVQLASRLCGFSHLYKEDAGGSANKR